LWWVGNVKNSSATRSSTLAVDDITLSGALYCWYKDHFADQSINANSQCLPETRLDDMH
jgi:hypothetical protein